MLTVVAAAVVLAAFATIPLRAPRSSPVEPRPVPTDRGAEPKPGHAFTPDAQTARAAPAIPLPANTTPRAMTPKPAAPLEQRASEPATRDPALAQLTSTWQREERDFGWSDDARDYVTSLLQDAHISPDRLVASDCHQSLCRIELRFESAAEASQAYELRHPDYDLRVFADGLTYTLFFPHEGQRLGDLLGESRGAPDEAPEDSRAARAESGDLER